MPDGEPRTCPFDRPLLALAIVSLGFYVIHASSHIRRGTPGDLLWACNVAVPMLVVGCLVGASRDVRARRRIASPLCAVALSWLAYGLPLWLLDIATGGD